MKVNKRGQSQEAVNAIPTEPSFTLTEVLDKIKKVDSILEDFDFDAVYKTIQHLDIKWYFRNDEVDEGVDMNNLRTPTFDEVVLRARSLLEESMFRKLDIDAGHFCVTYISDTDESELGFYVDKTFSYKQ